MKGCKAKVAVIIPCYNVEQYLAACLDSCITQTMYDIEIICVNDGSTDTTLEVLKAFAEIDSRIRIISQENKGLPAARNAGLRVANAEIIMFLDSDDYLSENACERIWCESREAPTDIIVFGTEIFPRYPKASNWMYDNLTRIRTCRFDQFVPGVLFKEKGSKPFVWRQAFRKDFLDAHQLEFDEEVKFGEDMVFQLEAFPHGEHFAFIADRLYHYRWCRENSLMAEANADLDVKLSKHLLIVEHACSYWKEQGWLDTFGQDLVEWMLDFIVPDARSGKVKEPSVILEQLHKTIVEYGLEKHLRFVRSALRSAARTIRRA